MDQVRNKNTETETVIRLYVRTVPVDHISIFWKINLFTSTFL